MSDQLVHRIWILNGVMRDGEEKLLCHPSGEPIHCAHDRFCCRERFLKIAEKVLEDPEVISVRIATYTRTDTELVNPN